MDGSRVRLRLGDLLLPDPDPVVLLIVFVAVIVWNTILDKVLEVLHVRRMLDNGQDTIHQSLRSDSDMQGLLCDALVDGRLSFADSIPQCHQATLARLCCVGIVEVLSIFPLGIRSIDRSLCPGTNCYCWSNHITSVRVIRIEVKVEKPEVGPDDGFGSGAGLLNIPCCSSLSTDTGHDFTQCSLHVHRLGSQFQELFVDELPMLRRSLAYICQKFDAICQTIPSVSLTPGMLSNPICQALARFHVRAFYEIRRVGLDE
mmetsp:Transcript_3074/g.6914  ORF Transcript_3074/g.6914 Transcript_3074/m.6914 type:complete len:259 (+) Transcript_3074:210-986(+)